MSEPVYNEQWLKCPDCGWTWRTHIKNDADLVGCNICATEKTMQIVDAPKLRKKVEDV